MNHTSAHEHDRGASSAQFRAITESVNDAIVLADDSGIITFWNKGATMIFGYTPAEVLGQPLTVLMPARYRSAHQQGLSRLNRTGRGTILGHTVELAGQRKDGTEFPLELTLSAWREGAVTQYSGIIRDISGRKQAEAALRASERKYRGIFDHAVEGIYQSTAEGRLLTANPALARTLGYDSPQELIDAITSFAEQLYVTPGRREEFIRALATRGVVSGFESMVRRKDGAVIWISENARAVRDEAGRLRACEGFVVDVTLRKRAEELAHVADRLQAENLYLQEEVREASGFGDLVGQSPQLRNLAQQIDLVAPTEANVLVLGESGTGKELVAREIHKRSRRAARPLIRVNCAAIPRELYESEFFGHVKGAFTGATRDRGGRFEAADGGTLFLDEVAEIPLELQGKLLRVLQEGQYERVGDDRTRQADVRIIAATNRDLRRDVDHGRFRRDLYYRLNVFPIEIAPLRERKEDIPPLAAHFLELSSKRLNVPRRPLSEGQVARLQAYDWPGNVRELHNVLERALITARGGSLRFDLPAQPDEPVSVRAADARARQRVLTEAECRDAERANLAEALRQTGGKIYGSGGAAELLGVKPTTLIARMHKMGLKRPSRTP